jgi:uncharacterized RmlC-like cupin family protein
MEERVRVVRSGGLETGPLTSGMARNQAFVSDNLWVGNVRTSPGAVSGWHHHGDHTTYGYVVSGKARFEFGPGGAESLDVGAGDFFMVPPMTVHRESNPGPEESAAVLVRIGAGPTVVNVDEPDTE